MALEVEDGSGKADAESYCSVAEADTYHAARGTTLWATMSETEKEQSLRRGTDYMGQAYGQRWKGERVSSTQALDWPRYGVVANRYCVPGDVVPVAVVNACAELAFRAASGSLSPDQGPQKKSKTVGPISVTYVDGTRQNTKFTAADSMLAAYMNGGMNIPVVRA